MIDWDPPSGKVRVNTAAQLPVTSFSCAAIPAETPPAPRVTV